VLPAVAGCGIDGTPRLIRPAEIVLACADYGIRVEHSRWLSWSPQRATGIGLIIADDCVPYCALGHEHSQHADLTLSGPTHFRGAWVYSVLRVRLQGTLPPFWQATITFRLT
jgi:hypothetical protein